MQWKVHVKTDKDGVVRETTCVVSAPTSLQALMAAVATLDLRPDEDLYAIHISRSQ